MLVGALTTVSRTVVLMAIAMPIVALLVAAQAVRRAGRRRSCCSSPSTSPRRTRSAASTTRSRRRAASSSRRRARGGSAGSGRVADIAPGLRSWKQAPVFGHGLGTGKTARSDDPGAIADPKTGAPIIFDDQYLNSLVSIGFLGLIGVLWFVWGGVAGWSAPPARVPARPAT